MPNSSIFSIFTPRTLRSTTYLCVFHVNEYFDEVVAKLGDWELPGEYFEEEDSSDLSGEEFLAHLKFCIYNQLSRQR